MANVIDILINAAWQGGPAVKRASGDLRSMSDNAASTSTEMASVQDSSSLLNDEMARLGQEVALGNMTIDEASTAYNKFAGNLGEVGTQAPKTSAGLAGLTTTLFALTAATGIGTVAAKKLYSGLKEGAELELTQQRFDRLAATIGTTGAALQGDLRIATQGMVSDMDAAALATDLMSLGLAKSHEEVIRLASASAQLGFDMNQLVLTLTNNTTMRFDALGVSVDGFEEKVRKLEEAGYDADKAFDLAFVEQAEEQIERVGSRAESTAGQIAQIEAAWTNTLDAIKQGAVEDLGPVVELLASSTVAAGEAEAAVANFGDSIGNVGDQAAAIERLRGALSDLRSGSAIFGLDFARSEERAEQALLDFLVTAAKSGDTIAEQSVILANLGLDVDGNRIKVEGFTVSWEQLNEALEISKFADIAKEAADADRNLRQYIEGVDIATESSADFTDELAEIAEKLADIEFKELKDNLGITEEGYLRLAQAVGGYAAATEYLTAVQRDAGQATDDLVISAEDLGATLERQTEIQDERAAQWVDFQGDLTDISDREGELRAQTEEQYEERRTEVVNRYGLQRSQAEEDFQRRRARANAKLLADIASTRDDSVEQELEFRARANLRLADLERDHLRRMTDIIEDAEGQLIEAAGRLDAASVTSITRQREKALDDEAQNYEDSRADIERQLEQQLAAERAAVTERIAELQRYNAERQRIEDEDRTLTLQRQRAAHDARIAQLEGQEQERLDLIEAQADTEEKARTEQARRVWFGQDEIAEEATESILARAKAFWAALEEQVPIGASAAASTFPAAVGPNATNLPDNFFQTAGPTVGDITINVSGADSPTETGLSVRDSLLDIFETFNK